MLEFCFSLIKTSNNFVDNSVRIFNQVGLKDQIVHITDLRDSKFKRHLKRILLSKSIIG